MPAILRSIVLEASRQRIRELLTDDDLVLDVGGGASPFPRADYVLDLLAYEERGLYGQPPDPATEQFTERTWIRRDMCKRERWPFDDRSFAFSVCSHTLEDVRDPLWVCEELIRVSRAGYIEVPSRLEEQSYGVHGPWAGWSHHRWLVDLAGDQLTFVFKPAVLHARSDAHFPVGFWESLRPEQRVTRLWWEGRFAYRERIFHDAPSLDGYLAEFVDRHAPGSRRGGLRAALRRGLRSV